MCSTELSTRSCLASEPTAQGTGAVARVSSEGRGFHGGADRRAAFPELLRTAPASSVVPPLSLPAPLHEAKQGAGNEETKGVEGQGSPDTARQVARAADDGVADPEAVALAIARGVPGTSSALVVAGKDVGGGARPVPSTSVPPPQLLPGFQEAERRRATELVSKGGMYDAAIPCTCVVSGGILDACAMVVVLLLSGTRRSSQLASPGRSVEGLSTSSSTRSETSWYVTSDQQSIPGEGSRSRLRARASPGAY